MVNITRYTLPTNAATNITGSYTFFQWVQEVSSGWFFSLVALAVALIIFIALKEYETPKAFTTAAFFYMIFSVLLRMLDFTSNTFMYLSIILVAIGVAWLHISNSERV